MSAASSPAATTGTGQSDADWMQQLFGTATAPVTPIPPTTTNRQTTTTASMKRPASARTRLVTPSSSAVIANQSQLSSSRQPRPQSARPSTNSGLAYGGRITPTGSRANRFVSKIATFEPTPPHIHRLRLYQSHALDTPDLDDFKEAGLNEEDQLLAAAKSIQAKMSLLEGERRAIGEQHRWESVQNESELARLQKENSELLQQRNRILEEEKTNTIQQQLSKRRDLKKTDPLAIAGNMKAKAIRGESLKQNSIFAQVAGVNGSLRSASTALIVQSTDLVSSRRATPPSIISSAIVSATSSTDPVTSGLKLRKCYDSLRHTADLKQKQYDGLAKEMEMMILKVKSGTNSDNHSHNSVTDQSRLAFNPFLLHLNSLHSRLDELMSSHNSAVHERRVLEQLLKQLHHEQGTFATTLQHLERKVLAREVEQEHVLNFCAHAKTSSINTRQEKAQLTKQLSNQGQQRQTALGAREKEIETYRDFFADNAAREKTQRDLAQLEEQKTQGSQAKMISRLQSRANSRQTSRAISRIPSASSVSQSSPLALMPGTPKMTPANLKLNSPISPPRNPTTALVITVPPSATAPTIQPIESNPNDAFLATLTPFQQTLCPAFMTLEAKQLQSTGSSSSSSLNSSSPSSDMNLLIADILEKINTQTKLRGFVKRNEMKRTKLTDETLANLQAELNRLQYQTHTPSKDTTTAENNSSIYDLEDEVTDEQLEQKIKQVEEENRIKLNEIEVYARQQARLDKLLGSSRAALQHLQELVTIDSSTSSSSTTTYSHPSYSTPSHSTAHQRSHSPISPPYGDWTSPSDSNSSLHSIGRHPEFPSTSETGSSHGILSSLTAFHTRLTELVHSLPTASLPPHLATIPTNLHNTQSTPLWPPNASDRLDLGVGHLSIQEEGDEEMQNEELEENDTFTVHHSPPTE